MSRQVLAWNHKGEINRVTKTTLRRDINADISRKQDSVDKIIMKKIVRGKTGWRRNNGIHIYALNMNHLSN